MADYVLIVRLGATQGPNKACTTVKKRSSLTSRAQEAEPQAWLGGVEGEKKSTWSAVAASCVKRYISKAPQMHTAFGEAFKTVLTCPGHHALATKRGLTPQVFRVTDDSNEPMSICNCNHMYSPTLL